MTSYSKDNVRYEHNNISDSEDSTRLNGLFDEVRLRSSSNHRNNGRYQFLHPTVGNTLDTPTTQPRYHPAIRPSTLNYKYHRNSNSQQWSV